MPNHSKTDITPWQISLWWPIHIINAIDKVKWKLEIFSRHVVVQDENLQWSDRATTEYANLFTKRFANKPSGPSGQSIA